MKRLDIPFNIDLLFIDERALVSTVGQIKSLSSYNGATKNFHPEGLYSTEIFGVAGTEQRVTRFGYIDLKVPVLHPLIFKSLVKLKGLYGAIMSGHAFAVWDTGLRDFVKSNALEGQTGYEFFMQYWEHIEHEPRASYKRHDLIRLVQTRKDRAPVRHLLVLPAGLRDMETDDYGRDSSDEINSLYYKLIAISNTIPTNASQTGIEAYNSQRMSIQNTVVEIYDMLSSIIDGKHGLVTGKWAARRLANGTRNVIVPMHTPMMRLGEPGRMGFNDTSMGIYQAMKATLPMSIYAIRNGFLLDVFTEKGAPALLCDPQTLQSVRVELAMEDYDRWMTTEAIEKQISYFKVNSIRNNPVRIGGYYLGLLYRGPDKTFRLIHGLDELPADRDPKDCKPITIAEFFYCSIYKKIAGYPTVVTRYPVTGSGSLVESGLYLRSTLESETRQELDANWEPLEGAISYQFPITGSNFYNALAPHPSRLQGLGADHDGDTASADVAYTDEAIAESKAYFKTRQAYVGGDGRFLHNLEVDTVMYVVRNLTGMKKKPEPVAA